ncbi:SIR2 family protein [Pasteurella atlantica]|uniref:SIR2 family protein n=1 Tax=Pasteurella atlantica TaxID=2827233 RepID=UPI001B818FB5|nr:SIR2 family protein [Pasteurella atlantica]
MFSHELNILKRSNGNNKLTIFVGAGVSKSSGLPLWQDLVQMIKSELSINDNETDYLKIAQLYYLSCGETSYYQRIKEFFPEHIEPTIIQKLIFELKPANIITTNWDSLLEKTARDNGYIYDVISKDEHLVQSELENHIIKMHGDFRDNNIVFKEDDYINYQKNFPLIENFIKSILSTNTILFIGYSYNDINLKQISKWIQNNSKSIPPMFLVVFKEDKNQRQYLKNFGIKTILIEKEDKRFGLDSYSNKLATFLYDLHYEQYYHIDNMSDLEIVDYIYNKLKPLDELNAILLSQVESTITNCGFVYQQFFNETTRKMTKLIFIEFYNSLLTYDINKNIRKINNKFREILNNYNDGYSIELKEKINSIISIFSKANIDGYIKTDDEIYSNKEIGYFEEYSILKNINDTEESLFNFKLDDFETNKNDINGLMKKAFFYYQTYAFLKAYRLNEHIIKLCIKQKNYIQFFLAMFNQNILLNQLKGYLDNIGENKEYKTASDAWQYNIKSYDLDEKFYELPKTVQKTLYEIKHFVSYDYLYSFAFTIDNELDKKIKQKKAMKTNSSMTFETNVTRNYSKHKNLIHFVLNNYVMIERSYEFRAINKKLIKISFIRQIQNSYFTLDKLEIFVVIKYIENRALIELIDEFDDFELKLETKVLNDLTINAFPNIVKLYFENESIYPHFSNELKNVLFICSKCSLTEKQASTMLKEIKHLIVSRKIDLDIYRQINQFIDSQENMSPNDLIDIVEMMIDKLICNKGNDWHYQITENNHFWSPFKHLNNKKISYNNIELITTLLNELDKLEAKSQIQLAKVFLINLYYISSQEIQKLIKDFMINIDTDGLSNCSLKISFKLFLALENFIIVDETLIDEVKKYPEMAKGNLFHLGEIASQVKYLVEKEGIQELEELLKNLLEIVHDVREKQKEWGMMII